MLGSPSNTTWNHHQDLPSVADPVCRLPFTTCCGSGVQITLHLVMRIRCADYPSPSDVDPVCRLPFTTCCGSSVQITLHLVLRIRCADYLLSSVWIRCADNPSPSVADPLCRLPFTYCTDNPSPNDVDPDPVCGMQIRIHSMKPYYLCPQLRRRIN